MDLRQVCQTGDPSPALVLTLIENLSTDSAFHASAAAANTVSDIADWRRWQSRLQANLLAAEQIDYTREGTKAHVGKKYKLKPHERPGQKRRPRVLTVAEINSGAHL